ncbi:MULTISPECIES: archaellin/type IV pilin N-terminal domain-containing protein [unclassified Methanoculleus]|jgi:flagellin-like protein|uniref:Archaellin/type IV pilin N-terminal domain-containing protein n=3 Tax=Methanoculleus TaxID=45989 RepID=A0ABD8ABR2_9EURY|nr:archaellin/type IV pilin N-terminal domain-containing protein [Methanoculleus sp. UBA377]WOX56593.1 archaellin/type IV pilin N-terminal domain-containing protein [Methanoculleus palmolei]
MAAVRLRENEEGVSVIVGTLLLILITVTAAVGLAIMISEFQKEDMERQSHIRSVENENLSLPYIDPTNNKTFWKDYNTTMDYSGNWSTLNLTIQNMNIVDSYVTAISVNGRYVKNYTYNETPYDLNQSKRLLIPARKSREVQVNFTSNFDEPFFVGTGEALNIRVMTSLYNTFERTFQQPTPVVHLAIETENLGFVDRDLLVLDGSDSFDDGAITKWNWTIEDGSRTVPVGSWSDSTNISTSFLEGRKATARLNSSGPFRVNLTVTDDTGMTGPSGYVFVPANPMFNPAVNLQVTKVPTAPAGEMNATVRDINGAPVEGVVVNFVRIDGDLNMTRWANTTDEYGNARSTWESGNGTIRVVAAKIPPVDKLLQL